MSPSKNTLMGAAVFFALLIIILVTLVRYQKTTNDTGTSQTSSTTIPPTQNTEPPFSTITPEDLRTIAPTARIVDLRTLESFAAEHMAGSILFSDLTMAMVPEKDIILVVDETVSVDDLLTTYNALAKQTSVSVYTAGLDAYASIGGIILTQNDPTSFEDAAKVSFVEPRDLYTAITEHAAEITIIDVRRGGNFDSGHVPGAISTPLTSLEYTYRDILTDGSKTVYVYGTDDLQSFHAGARLFDLGVFTAKTIKGGFDAWQNYDYPIEK